MKKDENIRFEGKVAETYAHIVAQRRSFAKRTVALSLASVMLLLMVMNGMQFRGLSLENVTYCGLEEHVHTDECMQAQTICGEEERPASYTLACPVTVHRHTAACYNGENTLICGQADAVVHQHTALCYDDTGALVCTLPAREAHSHNSSCYETVKVLTCGIPETAGHVHSDGCYRTIPGELICPLEENPGHVHTDGCYSGGGLIAACGQNENPGHIHTDSCVTYVRDALICGLPETESDSEPNEDGETQPAHQHTDACYSFRKEYTCGKAEGEGSHTHTADCFVQEEKTLICTIAEGEGAHQHSAECYTPDTRVLVCELTPEEAHIHTDECYETRTAAICGLLENHTHTAECYPGGDTTQPPICGKLELKEHTHSESCLILADPGHTHTADCYELVRVCGLPEHVHHGGCYIPEGEEEPTAPEGTTDGEEPTAPNETTEGEEPTAPNETTEGEEPTIPDETTEEEEPTAPEETTEEEEPTIPDEIQEIPEVVVAMPRMMAAARAAATESAAISIEPYVKEVRIKYRLANSTGTGFEDYDESIALPGDAELRVLCDYEFNRDVIADLRKNGGVMYFTLPDGLRAVTPGLVQYYDAEGNLQPAATMNVNGDTAYLYFTDDYLNNVALDRERGTFYITAQADLAYVDDHNPLTLQVGDASATVTFKDDLIAQYGKTTISKSANPSLVRGDDGHYYIRYTVTITADEYGCPDVKVADAFTLRGDYIEGFYLDANSPKIDETGESVFLGTVAEVDGKATFAPDASSNTLIWNIGTMAANETRTLTYLARIKDQYIGAKDPGMISNEAQPYSKGYPRESDREDFSFHSGVNMGKSCAEPITNADGTVTLRYLVWATTDSDNSYTLKNFDIGDTLSADSALLEYIHISTASNAILVFDGSVTLNNYMNGTPTTKFPVEVDASRKSFTCHVGDLEPRKTVSVVYEVTVEPGFFAAAGNQDGKIHNVASVFAGGEEGGPSRWNANNYRTDKYLAHKDWVQKTAATEADRTEGVIPVQMSAPVYNQSGQLTNVTSFEVPAGSFPYTVTVNEAANWDVSKAELKDSLTSQYMRFTGYVKVEACDADGRVIKTAWVDIDNLKSFTLKPESIGLGFGEYAVRLTYYSKLVSQIPGNLPQIGYGNAASLTGNVGYGGIFYALGGTEVATSGVVNQDVYFNVEKLPWYYDPDSGLYNGHTAAYWVIRVDADKITAGTKLLDEFLYSGQWESDAWLGAYILDEATAQGILNGKNCAALASFSNKALDNTYYSYSVYNDPAHKPNSEKNVMEITFSKDITLARGQSVYIFLRLHVNWTLSSGGPYYYIENKISHAFGDDNWIVDNKPSMELKYYDGISKNSEGVFAWDGVNLYKVLSDGTQESAKNSKFTSLPHGTYVQWYAKVNPLADLEGDWIVTDTIPAGMEFASAYCSWKGARAGDVGTKQMPDWVTDGWQEHFDNSTATYCYTKDNFVRWYVTNLPKYAPDVESVRNKYSVGFQIICRVTDPNVLFAGASKKFDNTVQVSSLDGVAHKPFYASETVSVKTIEKKDVTIENQLSNVCAFEMVVNPLGENLLPNATTITLVDEMCEAMRLNPSSVTVCDKNTEELIAYTMTLETNENGPDVMRLTVPDDRAILVSYQCYVQGMPGSTVPISNDVYWEGYENLAPNVHWTKSFLYSADGITYSLADPRLEIQKRNQANMNEYLKGAKFTVTEMMLQDGELVVNPDGVVWDESYCTTDADGKVLIGEAKIMKWNTIYKIVETKAANGYVRDSTPQYFAMAKKGETGYDAIANNYTTLVNKGVDVYFGSPYVYTALNEEAMLTVTKNFAEDGQPIALQDGSYTFVLYTVSTVGGTERYTEEARRTLIIQNGVAQNTLEFRMLDENQRYVIRELDSTGNWVGEANLGTFDDGYIRVNYTGELNGYVTLGEGKASANVTVTNTMLSIYLPETGGVGTVVFTLSGLALMLAAAMLLALRRREEA